MISVEHGDEEADRDEPLSGAPDAPLRISATTTQAAITSPGRFAIEWTPMASPR